MGEKKRLEERKGMRRESKQGFLVEVTEKQGRKKASGKEKRHRERKKKTMAREIGETVRKMSNKDKNNENKNTKKKRREK